MNILALSPWRRVRDLRLKLPALAPLRVLPPLTALHLLVSMTDLGLVFAPLAAWFSLGVALPRLMRTPPFWYVTATILGTGVYFTWESADNHRYLFVYWSLALCCAFSLPRTDQPWAVALSSRALAGLEAIAGQGGARAVEPAQLHLLNEAMENLGRRAEGKPLRLRADKALNGGISPRACLRKER